MNEMELIDLILTLVIIPFFWVFKVIFAEMKRITILLNKTREEYISKSDAKNDFDQLIVHIQRVEDKLDRLTQKAP
jgi:hypothetical protein